MDKRSIIIVGDATSGKTSLLMRFSPDAVPAVQAPSILGKCHTTLQIDRDRIDLALGDTFSSEEHDRLRRACHPKTQVILITFSIGSPRSLLGAEEKWGPEIHHIFPRHPVILVGCKKDLRHDPATIKELERSKEKPVSYAEGEKVARKIEAFAYLECSVETDEGVSQVVECVARAALTDRITASKPKDRACSIL